MNSEVQYFKENAIIIKPELEIQYSSLTLSLLIQMGTTAAWYGGLPYGHISDKVCRNRLPEAIIALLKTLEVTSWDSLPNTPIRVKTEGKGGRIAAIGHFMKDKWFNFDDHYDLGNAGRR